MSLKSNTFVLPRKNIAKGANLGTLKKLKARLLSNLVFLFSPYSFERLIIRLYIHKPSGFGIPFYKPINNSIIHLASVSDSSNSMIVAIRFVCCHLDFI